MGGATDRRDGRSSCLSRISFPSAPCNSPLCCEMIWELRKSWEVLINYLGFSPLLFRFSLAPQPTFHQYKPISLYPLPMFHNYLRHNFLFCSELRTSGSFLLRCKPSAHTYYVSLPAGTDVSASRSAREAGWLHHGSSTASPSRIHLFSLVSVVRPTCSRLLQSSKTSRHVSAEPSSCLSPNHK